MVIIHEVQKAEQSAGKARFFGRNVGLMFPLKLLLLIQ